MEQETEETMSECENKTERAGSSGLWSPARPAVTLTLAKLSPVPKGAGRCAGVRLKATQRWQTSPYASVYPCTGYYIIPYEALFILLIEKWRLLIKTPALESKTPAFLLSPSSISYGVTVNVQLDPL